MKTNQELIESLDLAIYNAKLTNESFMSEVNLSGVKALGGKLTKGAKALAGKAVSGAKAAGSKAKAVGAKAVSGAKAAGAKAVSGAKAVGNKTKEGTKALGAKWNNLSKGQKIAIGAGAVGTAGLGAAALARRKHESFDARRFSN